MYRSAKEAKGQRFGRLFVVNIFYKENDPQAWAKCRCDCDKHLPKEERKIVYVRVSSLRNGNTKSCRCLSIEISTNLLIERNTIHGETNKTAEYRLHANMLQRCYNKKHKRYKDWGGRGIKVYKPWWVYEIFLKYILKHLGRRPSSKHSIDRIDNDGNYEPGNIKWSTKSEQTYNRRKLK